MRNTVHSRPYPPAPACRFYDLSEAEAPLGPVASLADAAARLDRTCDQRALSVLERALLKETHRRLGFLLIEQGGWA